MIGKINHITNVRLTGTNDLIRIGVSRHLHVLGSALNLHLALWALLVPNLRLFHILFALVLVFLHDEVRVLGCFESPRLQVAVFVILSGVFWVFEVLLQLADWIVLIKFHQVVDTFLQASAIMLVLSFFFLFLFGFWRALQNTILFLDFGGALQDAIFESDLVLLSLHVYEWFIVGCQ